MTPLSDQSDFGADARAVAGSIAARMLGEMDDEVLGLHATASLAIDAYGQVLARRGLSPDVVLGQMLQVASMTFVVRIMPNYRFEWVEVDPEETQ